MEQRKQADLLDAQKKADIAKTQKKADDDQKRADIAEAQKKADIANHQAKLIAQQSKAAQQHTKTTGKQNGNIKLAFDPHSQPVPPGNVAPDVPFPNLAPPTSKRCTHLSGKYRKTPTDPNDPNTGYVRTWVDYHVSLEFEQLPNNIQDIWTSDDANIRKHWGGRKFTKLRDGVHTTYEFSEDGTQYAPIPESPKQNNVAIPNPSSPTGMGTLFSSDISAIQQQGSLSPPHVDTSIPPDNVEYRSS
jgi:hypothetical protein